MDFITIFIQFTVVVIGSFLGPILLEYFKVKAQVKKNQKRIALYLFNELQQYCFVLAQKISDHNLALNSSEVGDGGHLYPMWRTFQFADSIPKINISDEVFSLESDLINKVCIFVRKSEYYRHSFEVCIEIDVDLFIETYIDKIIPLFWDARELLTVISNQYDIDIEEEDWVKEVPIRES